MIGGFTGSRNGATPAQLRRLEELLQIYGVTELHHGASPLPQCADWQAETVAQDLGITIVWHPPTTTTSKDMLSRNRDIVDVCDILFASVNGPEYLRSGTWSTVRYARKQDQAHCIIWPDGSTM